MDKLTPGERILGLASLVLVVLSFLPLWAKWETDAGEELEGLPGAEEISTTERLNLWDSYGLLAKLAIILAIVVLIVILIRAFAPTIDLPIPAGQIYLGAAGITLLLMLVSVLTGPEGDQGSAEIFGVDVELSRGLLGLLGGVVASAAMAFGAWMHMTGEGSTPVVAGGGPTTPPPPAS